MVQFFNNKNIDNVRKAYTDDYDDTTIDYFAGLLGATDPAVVRLIMTDAFRTSIRGAANYKVYYHSGTCHAEREQDGNATDGGVPHLVTST